ncbi:tetratricopeptide repeat protein [Planktomarina temperata]|nr:tetratricopeptide repeat protein [Planktomarina temperata]
MAELTIDQALQQGIEAHKAGQVQEADRLYTAILKAQPKHPDANHNMGVLAAGVGKVEQALPFFKTALEANPAIAQFWLSYIDNLIKLDKLADAKAMLDQAKSKGAKGDGFDKLEQQLQEADQEPFGNTPTETLRTKQSTTLDIAVQLREAGDYNGAIDLLKDEINQSPDDANILALLSHSHLLADQVEEAKLYLDKAKKISPYNALVGWNTARLMLKEKKPLEALNVARGTSQKFPDDVEGMGVLGACLRANGEMVESLNVLNRAVELNPNCVEALINRSLINLGQKNKSEALSDLELAHRLKPHIKQIWDLVVRLKVETQEYSDAIPLLIKMIETDPEDEKRLAVLALCYQHLKDFELSIEAYNKALAIKPDYAEAYNNIGNALKEQGKLEEAIEAYNKALAIKPGYAEAYYNMGNALKDQGNLEEAIDAYNNALAIKPDYVKANNNMGNALQKLGKLKEAIEEYNKSLIIKADYAEAHNNMGNALKEQGNLEEAIEAYKQALAIKPDYAEPYNNLGNTFYEQGKLEAAIKAYKKTLDIKPDYADAIENSLNFAVQSLPIIANYGYDFYNSETQVYCAAILRPKYQIYNTIKAYLEANFSNADLHNKNFKACDQKLFAELEQKDKVFCKTYSNFIGKLLDANWNEELASENKIYHLGESHCLSYAHRHVTVGGSNFRIAPRITFGAKAFHFSRDQNNNFKAITKAHLVSLPKNSKVFLSYGEIDCRPNEGFISAAKKLEKSLEELIDQTTQGYVQWFLEQNQDLQHHLYFINVPAPVYNKKHSSEINSEVVRTVTLFNSALKKYLLEYDFNTVDVFKFTSGNKGFSNRLFHVDNNHLGVKALPEIEAQLF